MIRWLIFLAFTLSGQIASPDAMAGSKEELDHAQYLAQWGYAKAAADMLSRRIALGTQATRASLAPHERAQASFVHARASLEEVAQDSLALELDTEFDADFARETGTASSGFSAATKARLNKSLATALSSCRQFEQDVKNLPRSVSMSWLLQAYVCDMRLLLARREVSAVERLGQKVLRMPGIERLVESAGIYLILAEAAAAAEDTKQAGEYLDAGLGLTETLGPDSPEAFWLWDALANHHIQAGRYDKAYVAIKRLASMHKAGPSGAYHAWREKQIAELLYRADRIGEAEAYFKSAIQGQLNAQHENEEERLNGALSMLRATAEDDHPESRASAALFLLEDPIRQRFKSSPDYRSLVDHYARIAMLSRNGVVIGIIERLRGVGGDLDASTDERVLAALRLIESRPAAELRQLIRDELNIPDVTGSGYFGNVLILNRALQRLKSEFGAASDAVRDTISDLFLEYRYASRNDLAYAELFKYQGEVLADTASSGDQASSTLRLLASYFRMLNDKRSADDTDALSERETRRARREDCQHRSSKIERITSCDLYAQLLMKAGRIVEAIDIILQQYEQLRPKSGISMDAIHADSLATKLEKLLQKTELAPQMKRFFSNDGRLRALRIGQLCEAMQVSASLAHPISYCATQLRRRDHAGNTSASLEQERVRLIQWGLYNQESEVTRLVFSREASTTHVKALRQFAAISEYPTDARRLALLIALETRAGIVPRNAYTEAEILLALAELYTSEDDAALVLICSERALDIAVQANALNPEFLKRVLTHIVRSNPSESNAARVIRKIVQANSAFRGATDEGQLAQMMDVELLAASNSPPDVILDCLEHLLQQFSRNPRHFSSAPLSARLAFMSDLAVRSGATPGYERRAYDLMRSLLEKQNSISEQGAERVTVLKATIELARSAKADADLPELIKRLQSTRPDDQARAMVKEDIMGPWTAAQGAAHRIPAKLAAVDRVTDETDRKSALTIFRDAIQTTVEARQFEQAEALMNRLLEYSVRSAFRSHFNFSNINPFRDLHFSALAPCSIENGVLSPGHQLFPGRLDQCGKFITSRLRNLILLDAFVAAGAQNTAPMSLADGEDIDNYLAWETMLMRTFANGTDRSETAVLAILDVVRSPRNVLRQELRSGEMALIRRLRAYIAGNDIGWRSRVNAISAHEAIVVLHLTRNIVYAWIVRDGKAEFQQWEANRAEIRTEIRNVRNQFKIATGSTKLPQLKLTPMYSLYRLVMQPIEAALQGVRQVYLVTNGALALVPYSVLVTASPVQEVWQPGDERRPSWLLDRLAIRILRSLGEESGTDKYSSNREPGLLAIGDPVPASRVESLRVRTPCLTSLEALSGAADELKQSAAFFGDNAKIVSGADFTLDAIRTMDLKRYDYLLVASHALQSDHTGCTDESALVTSIGNATEPPLLKASAVASWSLSARLVVLSACETATDDLDKEAQPIGTMAAAFLDAGADTVIASNWPVISAYAGRINTDLFRSLRVSANQDIARSLHETMLTFSRSPNPQLSHPLIWGAPLLVGAR